MYGTATDNDHVFNPMERSVYRTAIYLRLSRDDGDKAESDSITNQRKLIQDFVKDRPEFCVVDEYVDDGWSGANFERPSFKRLYEDLEAGAVNCIIVKDLSRFGRNYIEVGRYLERLFPLMGVRLIAINDSYDGLHEMTQSDALIVPVKNLMNDAYCRDMSVKVKTQLEAKRKRGEFVGNFAPYGYRKDPKNRNHLLVDENTAENVKQIFIWKLQGMSDRAIADRLNAAGVLCPGEYRLKCGDNIGQSFKKKEQAQWSLASVYRILHNEMYCGNLVQGKWKKLDYRSKVRTRLPEEEWVKLSDMHEAIVDKELYGLVQKQLEKDTRNGPGKDMAELFTGYLHCRKCGAAMISAPSYYKKKRYNYYVCRKCQNDGVKTKKARLPDIYMATLEAIQNQVALAVRVENILQYADGLPFHRRKVMLLDRQIVQLQEDVDRYGKLKAGLYEDYKNEILSREEYLEYSEMYKKRIDERVESMRELSLERKQLLSDIPKSSWVDTFSKYHNINFLDRAVLAELVEDVLIDNEGRAEVVFKGHDKIEEMVSDLKEYLKNDGADEAASTDGAISVANVDGTDSPQEDDTTAAGTGA